MKQGTLPVVVGGVVIGGITGALASISPLAPADCRFFAHFGEGSDPDRRATCNLVSWGYSITGAILVGVGAWYVAEKL